MNENNTVLTVEEIDAIMDARAGMDYVIADKRGRVRLLCQSIERAVLAKLGQPAASEAGAVPKWKRHPVSNVPHPTRPGMRVVGFLLNASEARPESIRETIERLIAAPAAEPVQNAAVAAIQFALEADGGLDWLSYWNEGEFDICRKEWPETPEECFIGADPLNPLTIAAAESAEPADDDELPASNTTRWADFHRPDQPTAATADAQCKANEHCDARNGKCPSCDKTDAQGDERADLRQLLSDARHRIANLSRAAVPFDDPLDGPVLRRLDAALSRQPSAAADAQGERGAFDVELSPEQEERFSKWVGVESMTPWRRSVARLALLLNTTNRGLIDYSAAQHFACELIARAALSRQPSAAASAEPGPYFHMYADLCDKMGYDSGKDSLEWTPEEWAAELLRVYRAQPTAATADAQLCEDEGCPHHGMRHVCVSTADAQDVDFLTRVLELLPTWTAEDWNELLERNPRILVMLRPLVNSTADAQGDERAQCLEFAESVVQRFDHLCWYNDAIALRARELVSALSRQPSAAASAPEAPHPDSGHHERYIAGWNACRAALAAAKPERKQP